MARYPVDWVDAFTPVALGGNPCAVVHDADGLDAERRMAFVRETGLVECAYVVASSRADFGARYYLAAREIPMAGHPTIATVAALVDRGLVGLEDGRAAFTLEVGAGVMEIEVEPSAEGLLVTMTQARPSFGAEHDPERIAALYGLEAADILATPRTVSTGTPFCIAVLRDHDALRRARLDAAALLAWQEAEGEALMEPFLVTLEGATPAGDTFSRLLLAPPNPPEDPFTGSASGCMAAYLWEHGLIARPRLAAEQGHWMGRPGAARLEVLGPPGNIEGVRVGGHAAVVMRGTVDL